jgi:hypothetical protein
MLLLTSIALNVQSFPQATTSSTGKDTFTSMTLVALSISPFVARFCKLHLTAALRATSGLSALSV